MKVIYECTILVAVDEEAAPAFENNAGSTSRELDVVLAAVGGETIEISMFRVAACADEDLIELPESLVETCTSNPGDPTTLH